MKLGVSLLNRGQIAAALNHFESELLRDPENALACYNAGVAGHQLKKYGAATAYYRRAIERFPEFVQAYHNLGQALAAQNLNVQAVAAFRASLRLDAGNFQSAYCLALAYRNLNCLEKAVDALHTAIRIKPDFADGFSTLGLVLGELHHYDQAIVCLEQALRINPDLAEAYCNLGALYQKTGEFRAGRQQYKKALSCNPGYSPARWLYMLSLPMIYDDPRQIDHFRQSFRNNLKRLVETTPLNTEDEKKSALRGLQTTTNFYLQYQCRDDLGLQTRFGNFAHAIMAANFPQWAVDRKMPPRAPGGKIRIGYVSTYMYNHTVGTFLAGWLKCHDTQAFEIHCYHVGKKEDALTGQIRGMSRHFYHLAHNMEAAARQIVSDDLHILIHTDIGMDPITNQLAALKLAPVQCKGWGHPVTTGLPTIDYYLTSDLMEPQDADAFYSERLVRLPNLALCYHPPALPAKPKKRHELGIPDDRFVYLSTQSIFKYLPQHDDIYPRIAKAVPRAFFVFIRHQSKNATIRFQKRLESSFASFGLDAHQFCHFSKRLNFIDFLGLNMAADVLLDTLEWSGGKTTLEALSCGLPVVTLPGRFMRGRHACAILKMIGVTETIVSDKKGYCASAVRLAMEPAYLGNLKSRIAANRHQLFDDHSFMVALESFFRSVVDCGAAQNRKNVAFLSSIS